MSWRPAFQRALPLLAILSIQGVILFSNLGLLPIWTDELSTNSVIQKPLPQMIQSLQRDIHPPLYFLLLRIWPWHELSGLRAFSGVWAIATVLLADLLYTKRWKSSYRILALCLLAFSPCLLLYGRMARSYSMQTALALGAVWLLWTWSRTGRKMLPALAVTLMLLYTHYVPGLSVLGACALLTPRYIPLRRLLTFLAALACGYLPWIATLAFALKRWGYAADFSSNYTISQSRLLEPMIKAGYGAVSLTIGESFPVLLLLMTPLILAAAGYGLYRTRRWCGTLTAIVLAAVAIGFAGTSRWVSYPFIPARLLWALPFLLLAATLGLRKMAVWGNILAALVLLSYGISTFDYFEKQNYLNKGYVAPLREIAAQIASRATAQDLVLVDAYNTDGRALKHYLNSPAPIIEMSEKRRVIIREAEEKAQAVWIVRNQRDISPGELTTHMEDRACRSRQRDEVLYLPYEPWQRWIAEFLSKRPVTHLYQVTFCR